MWPISRWTGPGAGPPAPWGRPASSGRPRTTPRATPSSTSASPGRPAAPAPAAPPAPSSAAGPREITVQPRPQHEALQARRQRQATPAFQAEYRARAGVEGTLAQGLRVSGLRRARYVGLAKTHLQHVLTATALNVRRLGAWWEDRPFAPTRAAAFLALAPST